MCLKFSQFVKLLFCFIIEYFQKTVTYIDRYWNKCVMNSYIQNLGLWNPSGTQLLSSLWRSALYKNRGHPPHKEGQLPKKERRGATTESTTSMVGYDITKVVNWLILKCKLLCSCEKQWKFLWPSSGDGIHVQVNFR